jgi:hypothetical protein
MQLTQLVGNWGDAKNATPRQPFDEQIIDFLGDLSGELIKASTLPDIVSFAFWCRKANLLQEKEKYDDIAMRLGRGLVFHSTPSNVAINFAYSLATGLLAGNANILRLPAKNFEQVDIVCDNINKLLNGKYLQLTPYISMLKYSSCKELNDEFSSTADARVVWGGDDMITRMRTSPISPRTIELTFADRYSALIIYADAYLSAKDKERLAMDFYNDTYLSDGNACTSPSAIFWLGENISAIQLAKDEFWQHLYTLVNEKYDISPVQAVSKLAALYRLAIEDDAFLNEYKDNLIHRIDISKLSASTMAYKHHSGFFFETNIKNISEILTVDSKKFQTLTYFGIDKEALVEQLLSFGPQGIDRIVPMGQSMNFSLTWDGFDLIRELSRKFSIF